MFCFSLILLVLVLYNTSPNAANNIDVEQVKRFIPMDDYTTDLRVQKALDLVKENAVVDNTLAEENTEEDEVGAKGFHPWGNNSYNLWDDE